ncbi:hypothetical protein TL16_g09372 [Triparma laevis f. inornata]|uniref:Uncharacterized protein n=1 Tax=Triparma laevis f. inornata TaxID=1714386 RepID=A0A9W7BAD4_9STRA|nr:hypothetical protein TL16_g09372 [Triparma laevis f. inornata]
MDAYESDSDSGGRGGIPQSSILKQISAIQNISHEMSEPTRRSAESSFVSNVSWQQPGVRVTGGGREKLRPENVRSGTRIAHKIAKASIQELLLARSAMDLEENSTSLLLDTSTSETIFNKIMSFNKENSPTSKQPNDSDDHLETESIISMLSDTTNGTRTLAFSNLKSRLALLDRDDLGLDEISVDIDGGDNDSDSDDALSLANSISKEMGYILSAFKTWKIYSIIVSGWMLHLCFRKWYTLCLQVKTFKAKWLGRKRITLKSKAVKELKDNVKSRKKILSKAGEGFRSYRLRVIQVYFIRYLLTIKALKVKHLISIKVKSRIITNLKVKKDVENIKKNGLKLSDLINGEL